MTLFHKARYQLKLPLKDTNQSNANVIDDRDKKINKKILKIKCLFVRWL